MNETTTNPTSTPPVEQTETPTRQPAGHIGSDDSAGHHDARNLTSDPENRALFGTGLGRPMKAKTVANPEQQAKAARYAHLRVKLDEMLVQMKDQSKFKPSPTHTSFIERLEGVFHEMATEMQNLLGSK